MVPPRGHMFNMGLYRERHEKIFLSETIRPRVLIFGMKHHLVDLYQLCSNYAPWANNGPTLGVTCLHRLIEGIQTQVSDLGPLGPFVLFFNLLYNPKALSL